MKYKKRVEYLKMLQNWWDKLPQNVKNGLTRPGAVR